MIMKRAMSVTQVLNKKRKLMQFDGEFLESFGTPEMKGGWLIWGQSGSGKTSFIMMLCKYLTKFGRVAYNSLEEGDSESIKKALKLVKMTEVRTKFVLLCEPISELRERLRKHKAPKIVVIDSIQYARITPDEYIDMLQEFPKTLFIVISHAKGKEPKGATAQHIRYDSFIKIYVEGYVAFVTSRYGGGEPFVIWKERAEKFHGLVNK